MKKFFRTVSILLAAVMLMLLAACAPAKEEGLSLYLAFDEEDGNYAVDSSGFDVTKSYHMMGLTSAGSAHSP